MHQRRWLYRCRVPFVSKVVIRKAAQFLVHEGDEKIQRFFFSALPVDQQLRNSRSFGRSLRRGMHSRFPFIVSGVLAQSNAIPARPRRVPARPLLKRTAPVTALSKIFFPNISTTYVSPASQRLTRPATLQSD